MGEIEFNFDQFEGPSQESETAGVDPRRISKRRLSRQIPGQQTTIWHLMSGKEAYKNKIRAFSVSQKSFDVIERLRFKVLWCLGTVAFHNLKTEQKFDTEDSADKPRSQ